MGNRVERLDGSHGRFRLSAPLLEALLQSATPPPRMWVRLTVGGGSETVTHPIGDGTVKALQMLASLPLNSNAAPLPPARERPVPQPGTVAAEPPPPQLASLPSVDGDDWRLMEGVIWSTPVLVRDRFEGDFVGVFDRDTQRATLLKREMGLVSLWGRAAIWLHAYLSQVELSYASLPIQRPTLQLGERSFVLKGANNRFPVEDDLAAALRSASPGSVSLSFTRTDGQAFRFRSGDDTVRAWATIYQPAAPPSPLRSQRR